MPTPCPKCGRLPIITELPRIPQFRNNARRRYCECPAMCKVIPQKGTWNVCGFIYVGDDSEDKIFAEWDKLIKE